MIPRMDTTTARKVIGALTIAAALSLTACGAQNTITAGTEQPAQQGTVHTAPSAAKAPAPTPTPAQKTGATWGDTVTLPSKVAITLTYLGLKPATDYISGGHSGITAVFGVKVSNGSGQPVEGSMFDLAQPTARYGADGVQAPANGWNGYTWPNMTTIMPGETQSAEVGFDIPQAGYSDVRIEFTVPMYLGNQPAIFKGAIS